MPARKAQRKPTAPKAINAGEHAVRVNDPMPKDYIFVPKGNVYVTKHCRSKTHDAGKELYVVVGKRDRPMGLRCPIPVYNTVMANNEATAAKRAKAVRRRDAAIEERFEEAVVEFFPGIPRTEIPHILEHSLKKQSRRVGRTKAVALHDRVKLAVGAHIRHAHTDYDDLLKQGIGRLAARECVRGRINEISRRWGGQLSRQAAVEPRRGRQPSGSEAVTPLGRKARTSDAAKKLTAITPRMASRRISRGVEFVTGS